MLVLKDPGIDNSKDIFTFYLIQWIFETFQKSINEDSESWVEVR